MDTEAELAELREQAAQRSIEDVERMSAQQLRRAIEERRRGADPRQARAIAVEHGEQRD